MLTIRMFEAGDAFRLLGSVGGVQRAEKAVTFAGGYETRAGGSFQIEFRGPVTDAQPVREFLEPQLRDATRPEPGGRLRAELFRALAPMRSRDNMRAVAEGIEAMGREEAAYWLGMAMHRRRPRRVLTALRMLLTEPRPHGGEQISTR